MTIAAGAAPPHAEGFAVSRDLYTLVSESPCDFGIRHFWVNEDLTEDEDGPWQTICLNCLETFEGVQKRILILK